MKTNVIICILLVMITGFVSCNKSFLNAKSDHSKVVPTKVSDLWSLLDNNNIINNVPALGILSSDNYYTTPDGLRSASTATEKNSYTWQKDIYNGEPGFDWDNAYKTIFYANVVLDELSSPAFQVGLKNDIQTLKGSALFYRAYTYFFLASLFCKTYNKATADSDLGIPLRLKSNILNKVGRGTVRLTYDRILKDLKDAAPLLPRVIKNKTRPSEAAAFGMMARVYLEMNDYSHALQYADSCLAVYDKIMDYNVLDSTKRFPIPPLNDEMIYYAKVASYSIFGTYFLVDSSLYKMYKDKDLRKTLFFDLDNDGMVHYEGSYNGNNYFFGGIATDEIMLIKAECLARSGKIDPALTTLNQLLKKRYKKNEFTPGTGSDEKEVLSLVLQERRKELVFRGIRWGDLRRLNLDKQFAVTLKRKLDSKTYTLSPGDPRYVLPIPDDEIAGSSIQQNAR